MQKLFRSGPSVNRNLIRHTIYKAPFWFEKIILPKRVSVAISAPIKVFRLDSDRFKNLSDTERSTFNSGAEQYCSGAKTASKVAFLVWAEALSGTLSETLRFTIRYSMNIALMFCCGAEIVLKRSQCEQQPYLLCSLQRCLLIWKDRLPKWGSVAISAPIKVFRLDSHRFKNLSDTERSTFNSGAEQYCSGAETALKATFLMWTEALSGTLSAMLPQGGVTSTHNKRGCAILTKKSSTQKSGNLPKIETQ